MGLRKCGRGLYIYTRVGKGKTEKQEKRVMRCVSVPDMILGVLKETLFSNF